MPGWKSLIPFYNFYLWVKISGNSGWMIALILLTIINIFIIIYLNNELTENLEKVFYSVLESQYCGSYSYLS